MWKYYHHKEQTERYSSSFTIYKEFHSFKTVNTWNRFFSLGFVYNEPVSTLSSGFDSDFSSPSASPWTNERTLEAHFCIRTESGGGRMTNGIKLEGIQKECFLWPWLRRRHMQASAAPAPLSLRFFFFFLGSGWKMVMAMGINKVINGYDNDVEGSSS